MATAKNEQKRSEYPEHYKMRAVKDKSQAIGEFIVWLRSTGREICKLGKIDYFPEHKSIEVLLAEYFEIDLNKVEEEKLAMLEELRSSNAEEV